jgi:dTDP-4-amino-4,6-dideoxygalactose transaminase
MSASSHGSPEHPLPIGYGRQYVDDDDVRAVAAALRSERLTQGPAVPAFEQGLCRVTGAAHAVALSSGTSALHLSYLALGVGPGHVVVTSANTFLATATAALWCGAEVRFVDVEPSSGNLDVRRLEEELGPDPTRAVVVPVHFAGLPCDMQSLLELKRRHGFRLVEDAAHALGARWRADGRWWSPGEHPEVDAACLSFHPVKHVTTGEGGALVTQRRELAAVVRRLRSHGVDHEAGHGAFGEPEYRPRWFQPMVSLGLNARLSDAQAALGLSQLGKLPEFLAARREIAARYREALCELELLWPGDEGREHAWHLFVLRTAAGDRDALMEALWSRGIHTQLHYYPVPYQPWFRQRYGARAYPGAEDHARRSLSLPLHPGLSEADEERVIEAVLAFRRRSAA